MFTNIRVIGKAKKIFNRLVKATEKGIKIDIAQNLQANKDTDDLAKIRGVRVKSLDFKHLIGDGILHTKLWIADRKHFYVGSANFDWRSLTQVKEIGILATNCSNLARDMGKIWDVYWDLGGNGKQVPSSWPSKYNTDINSKTPAKIYNPVNDENVEAFLSSSPPPFCSEGRSVDIASIIGIIDEAQEFVHIAVMDYFPTFIYGNNKRFWPMIDNALKRAAIDRRVKVKLLLSNWTHTIPDMRQHLKSLTDLNGIDRKTVSIEGKWFTVPSFSQDQAKIPFARVNHNKYLVTDKTGYIGTSNWSADYFVNTGGIGFAFQSQNSKNNSRNLHQNLQDIFERDWNSSYATVL